MPQAILLIPDPCTRLLCKIWPDLVAMVGNYAPEVTFPTCRPVLPKEPKTERTLPKLTWLYLGFVGVKAAHDKPQASFHISARALATVVRATLTKRVVQSLG